MVRKVIERRCFRMPRFPDAEGPPRPLSHDGAGEVNAVAASGFEPLLRRLGQLVRHRTEQGNAGGGTGTGDHLEVMIAMPDDERRPMVPAVERVAGVARVALEFLGRRLPVV